MSNSPESLDEKTLFLKLKDILLTEDREELRRLRKILEEEDQLSEKVSPIIKQHLKFVKENFKDEYGQIVSELIEEKLKSSQDEIVNVIYPKLDTMIKKYITAQFQRLKENIDTQIKSMKRTFSPKEVFNRFFGPKESDVILSNLDPLTVHEIYIIQRDSGLLLGSYSKTENLDQDVIAGMLTAIKSFVEDAFQKGKEDLEMIQYENYKIFLQNLHSYYFAVAISGSMSAAEKEDLSSKLIQFADEEMPFNFNSIDSQLTSKVSKSLEQYFKNTSQLTTPSP